MGIIDVLNKILGDPNEKELKKLWPRVTAVNAIRKTEERIRAIANMPPRSTPGVCVVTLPRNRWVAVAGTRLDSLEAGKRRLVRAGFIGAK